MRMSTKVVDEFTPVTERFCFSDSNMSAVSSDDNSVRRLTSVLKNSKLSGSSLSLASSTSTANSINLDDLKTAKETSVEIPDSFSLSISEMSNKTKNPKSPSSVISCYTLSVTPPSYQVEMDSDGYMFNQKHDIYWPERPAYGIHSEKTHFDIRNRMKFQAAEDEINRLREVAKRGTREFVLPGTSESIQFNGYYHGALHPAALEYRLNDGEFGVFWPQFEPPIGPLIQCRLLLAYKSFDGLSYYFPLKKSAEKKWTIFCFDWPYFSDLEHLVAYLTELYFRPPENSKFRRLEHLPLWKIDKKWQSALQAATYKV